MFTGDTTIGWFALLLAAMLFLLDIFHWKRFKQKIQVAVPWNVPLIFLIAFAGTGLFCVGLAIRILFSDLSESFGSAERWLAIGIIFFVSAVICSYLHKKEEERNLVPLSQIPLLPANIQYPEESVSKAPLLLPVHVPRQQYLQLIENPRHKRQRLENRLAIVATMAATIALGWFGIRSLANINVTAMLDVNLPTERAIPTPEAEPERALARVLAAPQSFFSAAATGMRATFTTEQSAAPSELESAVTAADLNLSHSIATSSTVTESQDAGDMATSSPTAPDRVQAAIQESSLADADRPANSAEPAVIAIGGPIDNSLHNGEVATAATLAEELILQNFDVVIQSEYGANIRAHPSTNAEIITALPTGIRLTAVGRSTDGQWIRVRLAISTGAWVAAEVVDDGSAGFQESLSALPPVK